jgi:hypothetical protein
LNTDSGNILLAGHVAAKFEIDSTPEKSETDSTFYKYACLHWHEHVTALVQPSGSVIMKLGTFILGNEFVTWSEILFELKGQRGLDPQVTVRVALERWYKSLAADDRLKIPIGSLFVKSHESLSKELAEKADDRVLRYLPFVRLGNYYNLGAQSSEEWRKAFEYKKMVVEGYEKELGAENVITLRAKTSMLQANY